MIRDRWVRRCRIDRVTDGDTLRITFDDGRRHFSVEAIRLINVNATELFSGTPESRLVGATHRDILEGWVSAHTHHAEWPEWPFLIRTFKDTQSFNRYLGEMECGAGHSMNEFLRGAFA